MDAPPAPDEILLEIKQIGSLLRVAAIDPSTLTEVTFQAPLAADRTALGALARRKLAFVIGRQAGAWDRRG
jgi:hypothetical protein